MPPKRQQKKFSSKSTKLNLLRTSKPKTLNPIFSQPPPQIHFIQKHFLSRFAKNKDCHKDIYYFVILEIFFPLAHNTMLKFQEPEFFGKLIVVHRPEQLANSDDTGRLSAPKATS